MARVDTRFQRVKEERQEILTSTYKASLRKETVTGGGQSLEGFCFVMRDMNVLIYCGEWVRHNMDRL